MESNENRKEIETSNFNRGSETREQLRLKLVQKTGAMVNKMKKNLVSIHDLNDQYMTTNTYIVLVAIALYMIFGVIIYSEWMHWDVLSTVYFLVISVLTIGYGDFTADTSSSRIFTAFYLLIGVSLFSFLAGTLFTVVAEHKEQMNKIKHMKVFLEMKGRKEASNHGTLLSEVINTMNFRRTNSTANEELHNGRNNPNQSLEDRDDNSHGTASQFEDKSDVTPSRNPSNYLRQGLMKLSSSFGLSAHGEESKNFEDLMETSIKVYDDEILALRWSGFYNFLSIFIILLIGMGVMSGIEGWNTDDSFYWSVVTLLTVGYGDFVPTTQLGKVFTIFYALTGCIYLGRTLAFLLKYPLLERQRQNEIHVLNQFTGDLSSDMLESIFNSDFYRAVPELKRKDSEMTKCEFVLLVLQMMNKVEYKDIFLVSKLFDNLDKDIKGYLSKEEMNEKVEVAKNSVDKTSEPTPERRVTGWGSVRLLSKSFSRNRSATQDSNPYIHSPNGHGVVSRSDSSSQARSPSNFFNHPHAVSTDRIPSSDNWKPFSTTSNPILTSSSSSSSSSSTNRLNESLIP